MTDRNEYVAEAIETAYGAAYDPERAQKVIDWLARNGWIVCDVAEVFADLDLRAQRADAVIAAHDEVTETAEQIVALGELAQAGPRFVWIDSLPGPCWVNPESVTAVTEDAHGITSLWGPDAVSGTSICATRLPAAEVVALLTGEA